MFLVGCTSAQQPNLVPAEDRIPDSIVASGTARCRAETAGSVAPEDRAPLCSCVFREMQRTMTMREMTEFGEAIKAAGKDAGAKNHALFTNDKARRGVAKCISEFGGTEASGSFTPLVGTSLGECKLRDGTSFTTTQSACDNENAFHYRERILQDHEDMLRTGKRTPVYPCSRLHYPTTQAACEARGGTSVIAGPGADRDTD